MSHYNLQLCSGSSLLCKKWDTETMDFITLEVVPEDYLFCMDDTICFKQGVTLKDIGNLFKNDMELFSVMTLCPYLDFLTECIVEAPITNEHNLYALEVRWKSGLDESEPSGPFLYNIVECYGLGSEGSYPIQCFMMNEISHLPIILNENFSICNEAEKPLFSTKKKFTFGELLKNIIIEVSMPSENNFEYKSVLENVLQNIDTEYEVMLENHPKPCKKCGKDSRSDLFDKPEFICEDCFLDNQDN